MQSYDSMAHGIIQSNLLWNWDLLGDLGTHASTRPTHQFLQPATSTYLVKLLYFGMACHYSIAPWYPPYQPFSGIDRAMASWHGWRVMNLFSPKLQVKKSILAIDFIWIRALRLIFSQIYITRHCLSFFRPPNCSRILCFWEFRISENFGQANIWKVKTENRKSWNTKFSKT